MTTVPKSTWLIYESYLKNDKQESKLVKVLHNTRKDDADLELMRLRRFYPTKYFYLGF